MQKIFILISLLSFCGVFAQKNENKETATNWQAEKTFRSFTGKISGNKVRLRSHPDLDGHIIKQMKKDDLILVVGEEGNFWSILAPESIKAYIFKTYVLDGVIEANRVNVRLYPNTEAPIIGMLDKGEKIESKPCKENAKWLEIATPSKVNFYVAKEYVSYAGDVTLFAKMSKQKEEAEKLLNSAYFLTQAECKKPFNEMSPDKAISQFETIIKGYADFSEYVQQAKEGLALLQDNYLQKKIAFLELKANISDVEKEKIFSNLAVDVEKEKSEEEPQKNNLSHDPRAPIKIEPNLWGKKNSELSEKMKMWMQIEESLFAAWSVFHPGKKANDFYKEQQANAITLKGKVSPYLQKVKNIPGNYLLKNEKNCPIAFLYSTEIDLEKHLEENITLFVSPRPNNNFAFPAYFVNSIE